MKRAYIFIILLLFTFHYSVAQYVHDELFIKVKDENFSSEQLQDYLENNLDYKDLRDFKVSAPFMLNNESLQRTYVLKYASDVDVQKLMDRLGAESAIEYVEQVPDYKFFYTPNDIQAQQWNLQTIQAELAWNISQGNASTIVAVVDDAVLLSHQDLNPKIWVNSGEISGNGVDDDGNGYIDDVNGWDAADSDNDVNPLNPTNSSFTHGTHCAGIAAAATDNTLGIASIGFNSTIMPVKIAASSNQSLTGAYSGVQYAIINNADIISMSWGGGAYSLTYQNLFNQAYSQGIVCVAAAGNSNTSIPMYPASYNHVISVGATDINDARANFSNYGTTIDVMAPGVGIYSTLAGSNSSYGNLSGTSMACPLVSGIAALMLSHDPSLSPDDLETCLKNSCDNIDAQNPAFIGQIGAGRVNALQAMQCLKVITASFTSDMTHICSGGTVQYFDQSNNNPISWSWSFPGGIPATSTAQNPVVTYATNGLYNATLIVTNALGSDTLTIPNYITVNPPSASTTGTTTVLPGSSVIIPITLTGTPPFSFSYSDGTTTYNINNVTSNPYYITVTPAVTTTYTIVSMSDTNCVGTVSGQYDVNIVTGSTLCTNLVINGDFENGNTSFTSGMPYSCICAVGSYCVGTEPRDKCTNSYWINDLWDHTFGTASGHFMIIDGANTMLWSQNVSVIAGEVYEFSFWQIREISDASFVNSTQTFDILINGNVEQTFMTNSSPSNQWTNYGFFWTSPITGVVPLTINQTAGASFNDHGIDDIEFGPCLDSLSCDLQANFSGTVACIGDTTFFTDLSTDTSANITNWQWDFGDGDTLIGTQNPTHIYGASGVYNVQLIVTNDGIPACFDTIVLPILVTNTFTAVAFANDTVCIGDSTMLGVDATCGSTPFTYSWSPSLGLNNSNIINPKASPPVTTTYVVTVTDNIGTIAIDSVTIYVNPSCCVTWALVSGNPAYCIGDTVQLINQSIFNPNASYYWDFGMGATPSNYTGYTPPPIFFGSAGTYNVSLALSDSCGTDTAFFNVNIFPDPITPMINDTFSCGYDTIQFQGNSISTYGYNWTPSTNVSDPSIVNPYIYGTPPLSYLLEITDLSTGCVAYDSVAVVAGIGNSINDTIAICIGDSIFLGGNYQYAPGDFVDTVSNGNGCNEIVTTTLLITSMDSVVIMENNLLIKACTEVQLEVTGASSYSWYPSEGLSCTNCSNPIATIYQDISYYVVGNQGVCAISDTINIIVDGSPSIIIPNVFSPNDDDHNDLFDFKGDCITKVHKVIYNRWGQLMFESDQIHEGWDGRTSGAKECPEGTYFYIFNVTQMVNGEEKLKTYKGSLSLFR